MVSANENIVSQKWKNSAINNVCMSGYMIISKAKINKQKISRNVDFYFRGKQCGFHKLHYFQILTHYGKVEVLTKEKSFCQLHTFLCTYSHKEENRHIYHHSFLKIFLLELGSVTTYRVEHFPCFKFPVEKFGEICEITTRENKKKTLGNFCSNTFHEGFSVTYIGHKNQNM